MEQLAIFNWFRDVGQSKQNTRFLVVNALPGTGKTTTIIEGFKHIPASVKRIAYFVFNKKNQIEAEQKITDSRVIVKTLHSYGYSVIARAWGRIKVDNYADWQRAEQAAMELGITAIVRDHRTKGTKQGCPMPVLLSTVKLVSFLKNLYVNPTLDDIKFTIDARDINVYGEFADHNERLPELAMRVLELSKIRSHAISFDDMVWLPVVLNMVKPEFPFIVVDECQDMNENQLSMAIKAINPGGDGCLVGDNNQGMYSFRGSLMNALTVFKDRLGASELPLNVTRRCPKAVVTKVNEFLPHYQAAPEAPEGTVETLAHDKAIEIMTPGDAVLSRLNAPLMPLCLSLIRKGVSARVEGRDIGKALIQLTKSLRAKTMPEFTEALDNWLSAMIAKASGRDKDRKIELWQDQAETLRVIAETVNSPDEIESKIDALFIDSDYAKKPAVVCSSVHKAKGLEWSRVFVLSDSFNRRGNGVLTDDQAFEERNIKIVAWTRSKDRLVFVS